MISAAKNIQSSRGFKEKGVETSCRIEKKVFSYFTYEIHISIPYQLLGM